MIGMLTSSIGRTVTLCLGAIIFVLWIQSDSATKATEAANLQCTVDVTAATSIERERQAAARIVIMDNAVKRADDADQRIAELEVIADDFKSQISAQGLTCPMSDDLIERLRSIK
jgi:hypothetical protein